jgi:hypothetical protein
MPVSLGRPSNPLLWLCTYENGDSFLPVIYIKATYRLRTDNHECHIDQNGTIKGMTIDICHLFSRSLPPRRLDQSSTWARGIDQPALDRSTWLRFQGTKRNMGPLKLGLLHERKVPTVAFEMLCDDW